MFEIQSVCVHYQNSFMKTSENKEKRRKPHTIKQYKYFPQLFTKANLLTGQSNDPGRWLKNY